MDICSLSLADCGNFQNTSEWAAYLVKNTDGLIPTAKSVQHGSVRYILSEYLDKYAVYHRNHISDMILRYYSLVLPVFSGRIVFNCQQ